MNAVLYKRSAATPDPETEEMSYPALVVANRRAWINGRETAALSGADIYRILQKPGLAGEQLDKFIEFSQVPDLATLQKMKATAYLLQRLALVRAELITDLEKSYGRRS